MVRYVDDTFKPQNILPNARHLLRVEQFISASFLMALPALPTTLEEVLVVVKNYIMLYFLLLFKCADNAIFAFK